MGTKKKVSIGVFALLTLLVVLMIVAVGVRVYIYQDFPIFTDEEQIENAMQQFGIFADYL